MDEKLSGLDLTKERCPVGAQIEIEGMGSMLVDLHNISLFTGIAYAFNTLSHDGGAPVDDDLRRRITLLAFNREQKQVRVSIAKHAHS